MITKHSNPRTFSLAKLFTGVTVIAVAIGAICLFFQALKNANVEARIQAQERLVNEIGGKVIGYAKHSPTLVCVDLRGTSVDAQWIETWLKLDLSTSSQRTIIVDLELTQDASIKKLANAHQNVHLVFGEARGANDHNPFK